MCWFNISIVQLVSLRLAALFRLLRLRLLQMQSRPPLRSMARLAGSVLRLLALAALCSQALCQCGCPNSPPYGFPPALSGPPPSYSPARFFFPGPTSRTGPITGPQGPSPTNSLFVPAGRSIPRASAWDPVRGAPSSNYFFTPLRNSIPIGGYNRDAINWNPVGLRPSIVPGYPPSNFFGPGGFYPRYGSNWAPQQTNIYPGRPTPELYGPPWALDPSIPRPMGKIILPSKKEVSIRTFQLIVQHFVRYQWKDITLSNGEHIVARSFEEFESKTVKMSEATIQLSPDVKIPVCQYCDVIKCLKDPLTKFELPDGTRYNLLDIPKNNSLAPYKRLLFPYGYNYDDPYQPLSVGPFGRPPFPGQPSLLPPSTVPSPPGPDEPCEKDGHDAAVVHVHVHPCKKGDGASAAEAAVEAAAAEGTLPSPRYTPEAPNFKPGFLPGY